MEILVGILVLAIASVLVMGWLRGSLFCSIFLTLGLAVPCILLGLLGLSWGGPAGPPFFIAGWILLGVIWAPRVLRSPDYFGPRPGGIEIMPPVGPSASTGTPHRLVVEHSRVQEARWQ